MQARGTKLDVFYSPHNLLPPQPVASALYNPAHLLSNVKQRRGGR